MNYKAVFDVVSAHPSYPIDDATLTTWGNDKVVSVDKTELPNEDILAVILANRAEFTALSASDQQIVRDILYVGNSVPTTAGEPARDALVSIFGGVSNTIQSLAAAINQTLSRFEDAGISGDVEIADVTEARRRYG